MTKYKVGDKVRVRSDLVVGEDYGINAFVDSMEKFKGDTLIIKRVLPDGDYFTEGNSFYWTDEMLEEIKENEMEYSENDILVSKNGDKRKVLGVCGQAYIISNWKEYDVAGGAHTQKELDELGYTLYQEPEVKKMTVSEIQDALGHKVEVVEQ